MEQHLDDHLLLQVAHEFGTPLYVYNADKIQQQIQQLHKSFAGQDVRFFYASKALTNPQVLKLINGWGTGIDCSSINEAKMALYAGVNPTQILYTSNGIHFSEIQEAVSLGIHVNIDSLSNLAKFGQTYGHSYPVGLRLRPNILAGGNIKISTGHEKSKFGIPVDQVAQILQTVSEYNIHVNCLHIHTGSEIKEVDVFVKGVEILFEIVPYFPEVQHIDLGGGFKVAYRKGEQVTDMDALASAVGQAFSQYEQKSGRHLQVWFEPGKYLVSESGYFITQVNVMKETSAAHFVSVNSGFNHLIRPMFYDSYHYIKNISHPQGEPKQYAVVGNICETDTFAWDRKLNEVREGDLLAFFNAGAYGYEMSSHFNSRFKPAEVLVENGKPRLIRRRDTFEDLLRNLEP